MLAGSFFTLQGDGNLVLYPPGGGPDEWSAGTAGRGGVSLQLQDDGNLVLYGISGPVGGAPAVWQTGTDIFRGTVLGEGVTLGAGQFILSPDGAFELVMQADGNLVAYGAGLAGALWASGTAVTRAPSSPCRTTTTWSSMDKRRWGPRARRDGGDRTGRSRCSALGQRHDGAERQS